MEDIKEQLKQFFAEAADALTSRPFGGPTRPVNVPEFLKSCDTTKVPYLVIDKE